MDLYYVKTEYTASLKIEVEVASAASGYTDLRHYVTAFDRIRRRQR
jgi:hypothetical protein